MFGIAAIAALGLTTLPGSTLAQQKTLNEHGPEAGSSEPGGNDDWMLDTTALIMAPDGAWGTATDPSVDRAIDLAIGNCRAKSKMKLGCGAYLITIRGGWSLGIRCGNENIMTAHKELVEAERWARKREADLRTFYVSNMPPCVRVVTVDPNGAIVLPKAESVEIPAFR
jgi:hypothetical protein